MANRISFGFKEVIGKILIDFCLRAWDLLITMDLVEFYQVQVLFSPSRFCDTVIQSPHDVKMTWMWYKTSAWSFSYSQYLGTKFKAIVAEGKINYAEERFCKYWTC